MIAIDEINVSQARRPEEQRVVEGFLAVARRRDEDLQLLADLLLAHVLLEVLGPKGALLALFHGRDPAPRDQAVGFDHVLARYFKA